MTSNRKLLACIRRADNDYNMIENGDKIALGLSGGKDSMLLLHLLKQYSMFPYKKFEVIPIFLDLGFPGNDSSSLKKYCIDHGFNNIYIEDASDVYKILNVHRNEKGLLPCSICSRMKKAAINKVAHRLGCNKVAFAHHADDAIETLLMNEVYGGRIGTFSPKMYLSNTQLTFIRPLIYARENDIEQLVKKENIPTFKNLCGNDKNTERQVIKKFTKTIYSTWNQSKENYLSMLNNEDGFDLWFTKEEHQLDSEGLTINKVNTQEDFLEVFRFISNDSNNINILKYSNIYLVKKHGNSVGTISYASKDNYFMLNNILIEDLYAFSKALHYIENDIVIHNTPCTIKCNDLKYANTFINEGYTQIENTLVKEMYKKNPKL